MVRILYILFIIMKFHMNIINCLPILQKPREANGIYIYIAIGNKTVITVSRWPNKVRRVYDG